MLRMLNQVFTSICAAEHRLSNDYQLTMWLCTKCLELFVNSGSQPFLSNSDKASAISADEADIAHYIGGFVCVNLSIEIPQKTIIQL